MKIFGALFFLCMTCVITVYKITVLPDITLRSNIIQRRLLNFRTVNYIFTFRYATRISNMNCHQTNDSLKLAVNSLFSLDFFKYVKVNYTM